MSMHTLRSLRLKFGLDPDSLAMAVDLSAEQYLLLENDNQEAEETLDLQQWSQLSAAFGQTLLDLVCKLELASEPAPGTEISPITFRELRDRVGIEAARSDGVEQLENRLGWEIRDFVRDPEDGWSRKLGFYRSLASEIGSDWRGILACYG